MGAPAMNLLPGAIEAGAAVLPGGARLTLAVPRADRPGVLVGLRPEALAWLAPGQASAAGVVSGTASVVEPLGAETLVTIELAGHALHARVPPRSVRHAGESVCLAVAPEALHVFDAASGARL
jgi:ABC-type sugar transport system ATPase subunit